MYLKHSKLDQKQQQQQQQQQQMVPKG